MNLYIRVVDGITEYVVKNTNEKSEDDIEILKYGIEVVIMNISKLIIIFAFMYMIGFFKECIIITAVFGGIRGFGSGLHVKGFFKCLIFSTFHFLFMILIANIADFSVITKILMSLFSVILIFMYAPADTEEKPYLDKTVRSDLKKKAIVISVIYSLIWIIGIGGNISGFFIAAIVGQIILIHPYTYRIAGRRYNNYLYEDDYL